MTAITLPLYRRLGSCEPALCGSACCQFILLEVNPIYLEQPDLANWIRLHGITLVEREKRVLAKIALPCTALSRQGHCELYGKSERPAICADFPVTPLALLGINDVCTYTFAGPEVAIPRTEDSTLEVP